MINSKDFAERLKKIMNYYDESASGFAEKVGVQRSSISHILSGRNKPSLDFIMKILHSYPEVELYWLINGKGAFPAIPKEKSTTNTLEANESNEVNPNLSVNNKLSTSGSLQNKKSISRIVIFYNDGTFENFES